MTRVMSCKGLKIQYRLSAAIFWACTLFGPVYGVNGSRVRWINVM